MASRVNVNVNVSDHTRAGLRSIRNSVRQLRDDIQRAGGTANVRININAASQRQARATMRRLRAQLGDDVRFNVRVNPDQNSLRRTTNSIGRRLRGILPGLGRMISETLADGIGDAFKRAASNPIVAAGIAILAAAVVSILGAAVAGALVLAIGGAFIGLGALFASKSAVIQRNWKQATKNMGNDLKAASEPLVPAMHRAIHKMEELVKSFAPHFKGALAAAVPHVETFIDRIIEGFKKLGGEAAQPLEDAFNIFLDALGPEMEDRLAGMGDALRALANTVADHSTEIARAFGMVIGLITTAIDVVNFLANAWVMLSHAMDASIGRSLKAMATLVDLSLRAVEAILNGFSKIPMIGGAFEGPKRAVKAMREQIVGDMRKMGDSFINAGAKLDRLNKERKLRVNITSLQARLAQARQDLQRTNDKKVQAKIRADISDLLAKKRKALLELGALDGRTATTYVNTVYSSLNRTKYNPKTGKYERAAGGNVGIGAASGGARANMTLVGERGPELVDFSAGRVLSNNKSRQVMGGGTHGDGKPMVLLLDFGGSRLAEVLIDPTRKIVKSRGGVRATFGDL
jgi:hypothetical protein